MTHPERPQLRREGWLSGAVPEASPWTNAVAHARAEEPSDEALPVIEPAPSATANQVALWRDGDQVGLMARSHSELDGLVELDLGRDWVPRLFDSTLEQPHDYQPVFLALANGRFDETPHAMQAKQARFLEPHGIPPSPALLRERFEHLSSKSCLGRLRLEPLHALGPVDWADALTSTELVPPAAIDALQLRLLCEGHLRQVPSGLLDAATRAALSEFERRNRIYARGQLAGATLEALRLAPLELERQALVRVLVERATLELGVIEDGSARGVRSVIHPRDRSEEVPDVVERIRQRVLAAFGLETVEGMRRFYGRLGPALDRAHYSIAIDPIELPDYYSDDMALWVEIDRGDLYYEFPLDRDGAPRDLPIELGPTLTLFARGGDGTIRALARYRTTIGGWRIRRQHGRDYWVYKGSPVGTRVWAQVISAPVWLPPATTRPETLVLTLRRTADGSEYRELNHSLIGPSFGSVYGLLAAHHRRFQQQRDGSVVLRGDAGIRTHGSSDYTSIWRLASSGCHRLRNHVALRLFSFILAHRSHVRAGHRKVSYRLPIVAEGFRGELKVARTGYAFDLDDPVLVHVLRGRVLGTQPRPVRERIPVDSVHPAQALALTPSESLEPTGLSAAGELAQ